MPTGGGSSRGKLTRRAAVLALVVAVLGVSYASSTRAWLRQRSSINELNAQIVSERHAIAQLQQQKQRWHDPAYIRAQARLRFGLVMPGETGYRVIGQDGRVLGNPNGELAPSATAGSGTDQAWWTTAWGSVVEAGKEPGSGPDSRHPVAPPATHIGRNGHASSGHSPAQHSQHRQRKAGKHPAGGR